MWSLDQLTPKAVWPHSLDRLAADLAENGMRHPIVLLSWSPSRWRAYFRWKGVQPNWQPIWIGGHALVIEQGNQRFQIARTCGVQRIAGVLLRRYQERRHVVGYYAHRDPQFTARFRRPPREDEM